MRHALHLSLAVLILAPLILPVRAEDTEDVKPKPEWKSVQKSFKIPMRDGKFLAADLYLPEKRGRYPCVLIQTPYSKVHLGSPLSGNVKDVGEIGAGSVSDTLGLLDRENYAYVVVDWRGFYGSKEAMKGVNRRKWKRGQDGFDSVKWCAEQHWSNGKIGTWGGSALGKQQFDTAAEQPPNLVCCVPLIAAMGQRYEFYYEGGCYLEGHNKMLDFLGYDVTRRIRKAPLPGAAMWRIAPRLSYHPEKIEVPCLMISGWWDHFPDQIIQTFEDICAKGGPKARKHSKLLFGPWDHVGVGLKKQGDLEFPGAELASAKAAKAFLDFHLRGVKNEWEKVSRMRYWQCGESKWFDAEKWSAIKRETETLYLHPGEINDTHPAKRQYKKAPDLTYKYDPREPSPTLGGANLPPMKHGPLKQNRLLKRKDQLVYRTKTLKKPLQLNGKASLTFSFKCDRVDCDFTARLCDEDAEGNLYLVADTAQRAKLRSGKVELLTPGKTYEITLSFPAHAWTFVKGHKLTLIVSSGNWPRYGRNPHTGDNFWDREKAKDLTVTIHHDGKRPASLKLPRRKLITGE